jgi:hypothetical protein
MAASCFSMTETSHSVNGQSRPTSEGPLSRGRCLNAARLLPTRLRHSDTDQRQVLRVHFESVHQRASLRSRMTLEAA